MAIKKPTKKMKNFFKMTCIILVLLFCFNILPTTASSGDSAKPYIKVGVTVAVVVGAVVLIRSAIVNSKAGKLYRQGEAYAAKGYWDLAVQSYSEAASLNHRYKDVAHKLAEAKLQAETMFLQMGDEARKQEKFEEAEKFFRQALGYSPASTQARKKLDDLAQDLVVVYYRRGLSYETVNRWEDALREYEKAYLLDPHNQEVANHYRIAKTRAKSDLPLRAVLFFINKTPTPGVEDLLAKEFQVQMEVQAQGAYVMLDYAKVRTILVEQARALSSSFDEKLAIDIGRLLGVDEVIIGELNWVEAKSRVKIEVSAKMLRVPSGQISKEVKPYSYTFSKAVDSSNWWLETPRLAEDLVKKMNK